MDILELNISFHLNSEQRTAAVIYLRARSVIQDELKTEMRKKSLLVLIYEHLLGQGSV